MSNITHEGHEVIRAVERIHENPPEEREIMYCVTCNVEIEEVIPV